MITAETITNDQITAMARTRMIPQEIELLAIHGFPMERVAARKVCAEICALPAKTPEVLAILAMVKP